MRLPGRPRETRNREETVAVSTRFPDSMITMIDSHVPDRGKDRSEVIRQAVMLANLHWSRDQIDTLSFEELLTLSKPGKWVHEGESKGFQHVTMRASVDVGDDQFEDFVTTIQLLGHGRFLRFKVADAGKVDISSFSAVRSNSFGSEIAAHDIMRRLSMLPDANPWKLPLARQVMSPGNWAVIPVTAEQYQAIDDEDSRDFALRMISAAEKTHSPIETKLRAIANQLIADGTMHSWGGGNSDGPTKGLRDGGFADSHGDFETEGFDSGSLAQYVYKQAFGIQFSRTAHAAFRDGNRVGVPHPGDLICPLSFNGEFAAVYLGNGEVLSAEKSGERVAIKPIFEWGPVEIIRVVEN